jgi:hypothetical protein
MYAPQFAPVNAVVPPVTWFTIFIFFMEIFAIGFPIIDVIRNNTLRQETLEAIANWEKRQAANEVGIDGGLKSPAFSDTTTLKSSSNATVNSKSSFDSQKSDMLTMTALENALRTNAMPLLEFAALKDFSGENVSFLTHIADWRRYWFSPKTSTADHRRQQFIAAARIYSHFISLEFSEFPINISSKEMKRLYQIFEPAAKLLYNNKRGSISSSSSDSATPFDSVYPQDRSDSPTYKYSDYSLTDEPKSPTVNLDTLGRSNLRASSRMQETHTDDVLADVAIPEDFTEIVFDLAEREIKYLVLTNTWPKFVNIGRANMTKELEDEEKGSAWPRRVLCSS